MGEEREEEDDDEEKTSLGAQTQMSHPSPGCVGVREMVGSSGGKRRRKICHDGEKSVPSYVKGRLLIGRIYRQIVCGYDEAGARN